MSDKLPAFQFYPADWMSDPALRSVSYEARGLWADMLCLMHKSDRRGYLQLNGRPVSPEEIARMTGGAADQVARLLQELVSAGVPSATEDGVIFNRRMVLDEQKRKLCSEAGKAGGGNPSFKGDTKGGPKGTTKGRTKRNTPPSYSASSSSSTSGREETAKDTGAGAPATTNLTVIEPKKLQPHQEFVERWKKAYTSLNEGNTYQDDKTDYILVAELIRKHGLDACIEKARILGVLCKKRSAWFTKEGGGCFTIGKLRSRWNEIVETAHQPSEEDDERDALRRQEELRARAHNV